MSLKLEVLIAFIINSQSSAMAQESLHDLASVFPAPSLHLPPATYVDTMLTHLHILPCSQVSLVPRL